MTEQRGLKALEVWSRRVTDGHKDVSITDLTHSWRNGLGFCAIIHHYRPDLIDFDTLSKENIFQNNATAFSVAEKQLGIPALLDAEDMVKYEEPDRLSVATYLSELYRYFEGGGANVAKGGTDIFGLKKSNSDFAVSVSSKLFSIGPAHTEGSNHNNVCHVCQNRVFILERLIVDNKLYHRTCFSCHKCHSLLQPGAYVEAGEDTPGLYECATCPKDESFKPLTITELLDSDGSDRSPFRLSPRSTPASLSPATPRNMRNTTSLFLAKSKSLPDDAQLTESSSSHSSKSSRSSSLSSLDKLEPFEDAESTLDHESRLESNSNLTTLDEKDSQAINKPKESLALEESVNHLEACSPYNKAKLPIAETKDSLSLEGNQKFPSHEQDSNNVNITKPNRPPLPLKPDFLVAKSRFGNFEKDQNIKHEEIRNDSIYKEPQEISSELTGNDVNTCTLISDKKLPSSEVQQNSGDNIDDSTPFRPPRTKSTLKRASSDIGEFEATKEIEPSQNDITSSPEANNSIRSPRAYNTANIPIIFSPTYQITSEAGKIRTEMLLKNKEKKDVTLKLSSSSKDLNDILHSKWSRHSSSPRPASVTEGISPLEEKLRSLRHTSSSTLFSKKDEESSEQREPLKVSKPEVEASTLPPKEEDKENKLHDETKVLESGESNSEKTGELKDHVLKLENYLETNEILPIKSEETTVKIVKPSESYPDDLNPFKDEEDCYPDELNPFGDDEEVEENKMVSTPKPPTDVASNEYHNKLNPFDDEDQNEAEMPSPTKTHYLPKDSTTPHSPSKSYKSPTGSLRSNNSLTSTPQGTLKKRRAPLPPLIITKEGDKPSPNSQSPKQVPKRPLKPPPSPPKISTAPASLSNHSELDANKESTLKKKKRPAPPVPIPPRREIKKIPLSEIQKEMATIDAKQQELERKGRELELKIRDKPKEGEPTPEDDEQIVKLFEMVNQKNILFRRQAELMYIKRYQRLEEEQAELEYQIRCLLSKSSKLKTEEEIKKEDELIQKLQDIVDQRNEVVDSIDLDRKREAQEEIILEQVEQKKAELKAKIKDSQRKEKKKEKKMKKKKEKKEKQKEKKEKDESSGKSKKKWLGKVI